ncbi:hypothetical protein [Sinomonas sp. P10A9]|uniref:Yip1 domain-containing protein n=1 Tax=Sinomonas puerhi TaxID=3238584 RepID=A0AB39L2M8_9MICC
MSASASPHAVAWFRAPARPALEATGGGGAVRFRRVAGAVCLPLLFIDVIIGTLLVPLEDSASAAQTLAFAAASPVAMTILAWMELIGAALYIAGLLTVVGAIRGRGAWPATVLGVLGVPFGLGMAVLSVGHFAALGLVSSGISRGDAAAALDAFHAVAGPLPILFMLTPLVYLFLALAAWRGGLVPPAALGLGILFAAMTAVPGPQWLQMAAYAVGLVLTAWTAWALAAG